MVSAALPSTVTVLAEASTFLMVNTTPILAVAAGSKITALPLVASTRMYSSVTVAV
jgi:hypothetical protein